MIDGRNFFVQPAKNDITLVKLPQVKLVTMQLVAYCIILTLKKTTNCL